jgi:2-oxo-3-hexenedioate decarboxylase
MTDTIGDTLDDLARKLDQAEREHQATPQWSAAQPLTLAQAYRVQSRRVALRCKRGDLVVGLKQAFTNRAMMQRMGVAEPVTGILCRDMQLADGGTLDMAHVFNPRVEVEVMFKLARPLPADATPEQALEHLESLAVAIEIVDSRYRDFRFVVNDVVADNASACGFVIGAWMPPSTEVADRAVTLEIDGAVVASGNTAAILDHPLQALCNLARLAARDGRPLVAGSLALAGSAIDPFGIAPGQQVRARIDGLGTVGFVAAGA